MCCGRDEIPLSEIVVAEAEVKKEHRSDGKVALYTQLRGLALVIGNYGRATNTEPCWVPEAVALELAPEKNLGQAPLAPLAAETEAPKARARVVDDEETKPLLKRRRK